MSGMFDANLKISGATLKGEVLNHLRKMSEFLIG